jgi:hypothetical protein
MRSYVPSYGCATGRLWYMHDGAPAHFSHAVRDVLNNTSHDQQIHTGGPTAWRPHSTDLNPLDFNLMSLCKQLLLMMKRHVTIALWMPVRLSVTTLASLYGRGGP